ncbi:acyloxyacyl hydrolase [Croceicoccus bisphenolivorans]|uniref:acyloxyacyl hydrolase n=1 Tax=Croceicoccus bisphenolivorans TaxID=1783232 RepID=UPI00082DA926|nr:acyloxyacyl hydrolase [Croceicoccus bisphenolivorans]
MRFPAFAAIVAATCAFSAPAHAGEVFAGAYVHAVDTPFTFETVESGVDGVLGYRFAPVEALSIVGAPAPYVLASINSDGDTAFAAAGLSWTIGKGPVYLRPAVGLAIHDGPSERLAPNGEHYELGSRVLFEPEIALGARVSDRVSVEASWMHISHARLFNSGQNPGIDMMGVRVNLAP